jgi:hypothetical protein
MYVDQYIAQNMITMGKITTVELVLNSKANQLELEKFMCGSNTLQVKLHVCVIDQVKVKLIHSGKRNEIKQW